MISQHLRQGLDRHGDRPAIVRGARRETYRALADSSEALARSWGHLAEKRVGLCVADPFAYVAAVAALDQLNAHVFLAGMRSEEDIGRLSQGFDWAARLGDADVEAALASPRPPAAARTGGRGLVTILTSGTSGIPKAANHTWETLVGPIHRDDQYAETRWFCPYPLSFYAGLQVFLQSFFNNATLVVPPSLEPLEISRAMQEGAVHYAAGTPTFWRWLLAFAPRERLQACALRQITLSGEMATQDVLDGLRQVFPTARVIHVYGLTETGRLFSVSDGKEGFPAKFLEESPRPGIELRVVDGQLMTRSVNAMLAYDGHNALREEGDGWFATGDLVEVRGDRVVFRGRNSDVINVGGRKVMPAEVEAVLRSVPGVGEVRVYARKSSLAGYLVAADLVLASGADPERTKAEAQRIAREKLAPHQVPRWVNVVAEIPRSEAFKTLRRGTEA
jgi:acyl-CoA synthetase (AMP-forming)/AMP-acid ligase II